MHEEDRLLYLALHLARVDRRIEVMHELLEGRLSLRQLHLRTIQKRYGITDFSEAVARAERELVKCEEQGCRIVTPVDAQYPPGLKDRHPSPPAAIWVRGSMVEQGVVVVGSRAVSSAAMRVAHTVATALVEHDIPVISGGAYGIDGAAHRAALAGGGRTYVFSATGLDVPYPSRHAPLFDEATRSGGVLAFVPLGTNPRRWAFLQRNGYMAACASAVVLVAANYKSGALSTVRHALSMGVPVFAIPGSAGARRALLMGARPVHDPAKIADALTSNSNSSISERPAPFHSLLAEGPKSAEEIAARTGETVSRVMALLNEAMLDGTVVRVGGLYALATGGSGHGKGAHNR